MLSSDNIKGSEELVREQLAKILSSPEFKNSQVLTRFLQFIVEEFLAGRAQEIKEYTIGVRALGRAADFNPQFDAVVRIHAGRLRRMLREYYSGKNASDLLVIEIPKGSYVPTFQAPNIEDTGQHEVASGNDIDKEYDSRLYHKATVAVLPFHNLSADDSKNYFAEGIGEQLCVELARFQHLSVISYFSTYKVGAEKDGREMHKLFDIDYAIMGSTRFFDDLVQINVQLTLAETNAVLWSQSFVKQLNGNDVLKIQEEVIREVLYKIADDDGVITKSIVNSPAPKKKGVQGVYEAVYSYFSLRSRYDHDSFERVKLAIEQVASMDENNALIWALLSRLYLNSYIFKLNPNPEDLEKGQAFAEKALWLDQNCQYAYKALAWSHLVTGRTNDCRKAIEQCLDLNPNAPSILGSLGFLNICIGEYAPGFDLLLKTLPQSLMLPWYCNIGFALYYYHAARYEEAFVWAQKAQPSDMPFISIISIAMAQNVANSKVDEHKKQLPSSFVTDHSASILALFLHDRDLRERLARQLKSSGIGV